MRRILIYTGAGLLLLLLLLAGGLWIFRNHILNRMAERRIAKLEQRYGLEVNYDDLRFEGTGRLFLNGLIIWIRLLSMLNGKRTWRIAWINWIIWMMLP
jgi:hypothetical protein